MDTDFFLPASVASACPHLVALLADLAAKHIAPSGASRPADAQLAEAREALHTARRRYFERTLLLDELASVARGGATDLRTANGEPVRLPGAAATYLSRALALADAVAASALGVDPVGARVRLCGLDAAAIEWAELGSDHATGDETRAAKLARVNAALAPALSGALAARLGSAAALAGDTAGNRAADLAGHASTTKSAGLAAAIAGQLAARVTADAASALATERRIARKLAELEDKGWQSYNVTARRLDMLGKLVNDFLLDSQPRQDDVYNAFLLARADALRLKLSMLHLSVLSETYTPARVAALRVIREQLLAAVAAARASLSDAVARLDAFGRMGAGLDGLVASYAALLDDLANKRWAITELRSDTRFGFE